MLAPDPRWPQGDSSDRRYIGRDQSDALPWQRRSVAQPPLTGPVVEPLLDRGEVGRCIDAQAGALAEVLAWRSIPLVFSLLPRCPGLPAGSTT